MSMMHQITRTTILGIIFLLFQPKITGAAVRSNHAFSTFKKPRFLPHSLENILSKKRSQRLLATVPRVDDDYSEHRIASIDEEPTLYPLEDEQQQQQQEAKHQASKMPAWKRLFTKPTQSIWPIHSSSSSSLSSKVPMDTTNNNNTTKAPPTPSSFQKDYRLNDTAIDEFLSHEYINDSENKENDEAETEEQQQPPRQTSSSLDIQDLVPALTLSPSLSFRSIRTRLLSVIRNINTSKWTMTAIQLGLAFYLLNAVVQAASEVLEELGGDSSPHLLKEDQVKEILATLETIASGDTTSNNKRDSSILQQQPTLQHLTATLIASGMPLRSEEENSIEQVLLSLTRMEANLLQQCLWTPRDKQDASFKSIAGLQSIKTSLVDLVWTIKANSSKKHAALNPYFHLLQHPPGILLYGPPGCGKTLLVKALAATTQLPCLVVTPSVLLRKYVGDTNLQVRSLFTLAQKLSPCILCIDELDGLFRERSSTEHDVSRDLKTEFLQHWDGITSQGQILVVGATNRPFEVDSAVLRRMPQSYFVGLPNYQARKQLLHSLLATIPTSFDLQVDSLASDTEGYTPSDLKQVVRMAITMGPIREARFSLKYRPLSMKDVVSSKQVVSPTPLTPGYRQALIHYNEQQQQQQGGGGGYSSSRGSTSPQSHNAENPWDSFFNAGTIHATHGSNLDEGAPLSDVDGGDNLEEDDDDDDLEEDYSYDHDDDDDESESEDEQL